MAAAILVADTGVKGAKVCLVALRLADGLGRKGIVLFSGWVTPRLSSHPGKSATVAIPSEYSCPAVSVKVATPLGCHPVAVGVELLGPGILAEEEQRDQRTSQRLSPTCDRNPLTVPAEEIAQVQVLETVVGGHVVYEAPVPRP